MKNILILVGIIGAIFLLGVFVYWPSFFAPLQLDDYGVIIGNPLLHQIKDIGRIWHYDPSRFLTHLSFALNVHYGGFQVLYFHTVNFILHVLNAFLVYALCFLLLSPRSTKDFISPDKTGMLAAMASIIFLIHPLQTSAVTYISQRATLLVTFFYLSSLIFYILARSQKRIVLYAPALVAAFLADFCKPVIVTLPLILILYEICFPPEDLKKRGRFFLRVVPFVLIVAIVPLLLSYWKFKSLGFGNLARMTSLAAELPRQDYLLTQFNVLVTYLRLLIVPVNQNLDYEYEIARMLFEWPTLYSFLVLLSFLALAVWSYRKCRVVSFCIFFFFLTLSLESSIFPLPDLIFEHRMYLPLSGLSLLIACAIVKVCRSDRMRVFTFLLLVLYFSIFSLQRNIIWSQRFSLLLDVVAKSPNKARVYNSLGLAYADVQMFEPALDAFNQALQRDPRDIKATNNRATLYRLMGNYDLAIKDFNTVLQMDEAFTTAYYFRGMSYAALGDYTQALADINKAARMGFPVNPQYINNLNNKVLAR